MKNNNKLASIILVISALVLGWVFNDYYTSMIAPPKQIIKSTYHYNATIKTQFGPKELFSSIVKFDGCDYIIITNEWNTVLTMNPIGNCLPLSAIKGISTGGLEVKDGSSIIEESIFK